MIKVLIGMVRTKIAAILIGPAGMGILAICNNLEGLAAVFSGFGLNSSGIKAIAEKVSENDAAGLEKLVSILRLAVWLTGLFGLVVMVLLCYPLAWYSFGDKSFAWMVALLGIGVALNVISMGQQGILQGMRRIGDLAWIGIGMAIGSTLIAIPCYYFLGMNGIALSLTLGAGIGFLFSSYYVHKLMLPYVKPTWLEFRNQFCSLFRLGISFAIAALFNLFASYLILILINRQLGLKGSGMYQAAFGLTGVLINFVLTAMSTDYFPRLAGECKNPEKMCRTMREQARISLFLVLPGLLAMMILSPLLIKIFYSDEFSPAAFLLQLFTFGALIRSMSWSLGFVLLAVGQGTWFMLSEITPSIVHVVAVYIGLRFGGLPGAALGYAGMYIFYIVFVSIVVYRRTGLAFGKYESFCLLGGLAILGAILSLRFCHLPRIADWSICFAVFALAGFVCLKLLMKQTGLDVAWVKDYCGKFVKRIQKK